MYPLADVDTVECSSVICFRLLNSKDAYWTEGRMPEPFCGDTCCDNEMERRESRLVERT